MRDKVKRFISILMTALMLVNLLPVGALAEGVMISNSVQSIAQKPDGYPVFVFVEVQGNTDGLTMNSDKWFTLGMVKSMNDVTKPPKPVTGYQNNINGVTADDVTAAMTRYKPNESINLGGIRWKGFKSENGASDTYPAYKNQACWHLDGWIKIEDLKVNYTIRYVDENNNKEIASSETKTGKAGSYTKLENNDIKDITGYTYTGKYDPMQKLVGGKDTVINVYYRPNSYKYRVEHYYDGEIDNSKTDISRALYGSNVNVGTDAYKLKDGYEHEKTENSPLTIGTDESKNVIKVYYKKIGYTVKYNPGEHGDFEPKAYDAKHGDATPAFDGETTGKPGWKFDGWEPEVAKTVTGNATYTAKFVPDKTKIATVLYTISIGQSDYGSIAPSAQQIILQATGKLDSDVGGSVSGSTATAKPGYKFAGWYKATGEATYEWVTGDPELTSELAESKLNRDEKTGLYQNTVFEERFEPDAGAKVPVTYKAENGTLKGTTSQEAQVVTGEGLTDVTATPNTGYKFDGWYVVDKNDNEIPISGLAPAEKLDAKTAKEKLNKDGNLYADTTFIARFVPDENQTVPVIYTTDENGILWGGPAIGSITYNVNIATGKVWLNNAFVDKLEPVPTYPKDGYEFDRWIRVSPEKTIEGADSTLTDEKARPNLNQNQENGLYQKTEFKAIFKPQTNLSYTVNYYWNGTEIPVKPSKTVLHQTFGAEATESPVGADDYTPVSTESKTITLGTGKNEINFYYYRNVKLTANSRTLTYDGYEHGVSGFTGAPEEADFSAINVGANGTDANTYPANFAEGTVGTVDKTEKYIVTKTTDGQLVIEKRKVTLTSEGGSKVYDGAPLTKPEVQIEGSFVDGEVLGIVAQGTVTDVSEGEVTNTIFFNRGTNFKESNYDIQKNEGKLSITKRNVVLTSETASKPYDGNPLTKPDVTVTGDGFVKGEVSEIKAKGSVTHVSHGKVTNTITYTKGANFKESNYTITKKEGELWITGRTDEVVVEIEGRTKTVTYNGEEHTAWKYDVIDISDPLYITAPDEVPNFWNKNAKGARGTDAGTYAMGWEAADFENTNTNFSNVTFVVTDGSLTITKRAVTLTSASDSKVYDGNALTNGEVTVSGDGFAKDEGATYNVTGSQTVVGTSDNTFTYTLNKGTNANNYSIELVPGKLEVTPVTDTVTVTITGRTDEMPYDGKEHSVFGYDVTVSNALYTPKKDMQFNGIDEDMTAKGTDAGTYPMGLEDSDFTNISDNFSKVTFKVTDGSLTITKRPVKLTSASDSKTYDGQPLTNGTVTDVKDEMYLGFVEGEGATYNVTGTQTNVGKSNNTFTYTLNEGTKADNYTITTAEGELEVTPVTAKVTVTITEKSGTATYDGGDHIVSGYASMTADNELYDVDASVQETPTAAWAAKGTNVGEYPVGIVAGDFKNTNANFTNVKFVVVDGKLTITPAPVTLQAPIQSKTYDGTPLEATQFGHSYLEGVNFADDFASVILTGSQTLVGSSASLITGVIPNEGKKLTNYNFTFVPGTLTVTDGTGDDPVKPENVVTKTHIPKDMGYNLGEPVTFTISVKNIYNTPKTITLTEKENVKFSNGENVIVFNDVPAGETVTAEATYTITSEDILEGVFHNTVTADFTGGGSWTAEDTVTTAELNTTLNVTKTSDVPEGQKAALGQTITYTIKVQNAGNVPYTNVKVEDPLTKLTATIETLAVGETKTFTTEYVVTEADVLKGSVLNTATATGDKIKDPKSDEQKEPNGGDEVETPTFAPITIKPKDVTATYNGAAITGKDVEITSGKLLEGHKLSAAVIGSGVNAGSYELTLDPEKIKIVDANNKDVSEMYARTILPGKLIINKRSVLITSQSATKTYDGSALTRPAVTITGDGFVPGELAKAEATGSITNVGSTPNAIQYTTTGAFNAANYSIALSVGTLTVTAKPEPEPRRTFNLTISYVYQNGKRAAASYNRGGLKNGETFDITSPVIAGYTASETVVSGTIYNRDIKVTVIYTADGVNLDDYGVPLGLGNITMNVGDCFE